MQELRQKLTKKTKKNKNKWIILDQTRRDCAWSWKRNNLQSKQMHHICILRQFHSSNQEDNCNFKSCLLQRYECPCWTSTQKQHLLHSARTLSVQSFSVSIAFGTWQVIRVTAWFCDPSGTGLCTVVFGCLAPHCRSEAHLAQWGCVGLYPHTLVVVWFSIVRNTSVWFSSAGPED